jgi:uncharacterized protein YyaL (SSP411 family)
MSRDAADEERLAPMRDKLLAVRSRRVRPGLDDKVLADWNGLMISGLVNAAVLLDQPDWIERAARAFLFIAAHMSRGDRLGHSWRDGRLLFPGLASDHAVMIRAALALYEATGEADYLERALSWQGTLDRHYANADTSGYFLPADDADGVVVRPAAITDEATPNPNGVAAQNLIRLAACSGQHAWRDQVDKMFDGLIPIAAENVFMHVTLLNALDLRLRSAEVVIAGTGKPAERLAAAALKLPFTERTVVRAPTAEALPPGHYARHKVDAVAAPAAFVCINETCSLPVSRPDKIAETAKRIRAQ